MRQAEYHTSYTGTKFCQSWMLCVISLQKILDLQSIVDELMRQKNGVGPSSPRYSKRSSLTYVRRDGSSQLITPSSSSDTLSSAVSIVLYFLYLQTWELSYFRSILIVRSLVASILTLRYEVTGTYAASGALT